MTGIREKMWLIIAAFLAVCLITGIVFLCVRLYNLQPAEIILSESRQADISGDVYICGSVARPGIYAAQPGDTLTALVSAAGVSDNADIGAVSIRVPAKGETAQPQKIDLNRAEGPLHSVDDLLKIKGFGISTVEDLRPFVTVGE
ncbi:MAG: hypothetical protein NT177_05605 [Chloroflexi bacterium]|nr:hypothetical protein [Chloroflexota bacterium]